MLGNFTDIRQEPVWFQGTVQGKEAAGPFPGGSTPNGQFTGVPQKGRKGEGSRKSGT